MNSNNLGRSLGAAVAMALVLVGAGCSTVGYKTGDGTSASLHRASRCVAVETEALNATISSLAELVSSPATDLKPQFKTYRASLKRLTDAVEDTDRSMVKLRKQSAEYLAAWDEELAAMNYQVIRDSSLARRAAVSNQVEVVCRRYDETQAVVKPFISYFTDLERSLGTDLTMEGLASAREVVHRAEENTRKVQAALEQLSNELNVSSGRLSSVISTERSVKTASGSETGPQARVSGVQQ